MSQSFIFSFFPFFISSQSYRTTKIFQNWKIFIFTNILFYSILFYFDNTWLLSSQTFYSILFYSTLTILDFYLHKHSILFWSILFYILFLYILICYSILFWAAMHGFNVWEPNPNCNVPGKVRTSCTSASVCHLRPLIQTHTQTNTHACTFALTCKHTYTH